jgi:site-specific DNA-methyltransferase (adenine-specific)
LTNLPETGIIHIGDNIESLRKLPDNSVDMCITSPPYYNLRDYKNKNQIGTEDSVTEFVENLCNVFDEVYRVLKPTGSCWVNIGDTYNNKKLLQVPSRFEIAMSGRGWYLRNEIIWSKPNPQPISAKDRFWSNHEKIFWFVKNLKGYYFDRSKMVIPQAEVSVRRMFSDNNLDKRKDAKASVKEGYSLSSDNQDKHYTKMREILNIKKDFDYQELIDSGKCPTRPMFSVWDIATTSYKGAHFAVYPQDLIKTPISTTCPPNGIVLDPFMGSGTTAIVSKSLGKKYIGCELSPEYVEIAEQRLKTSTLDDFL